MGKKLLENRFRGNTNLAASKLSNYIIWMPVESRASKRMPDQHFINSNGVAGWVELKTIDDINQRVKFQAGQARWLRKYRKLGGNCWVAVEYPGGVSIFSGIYARLLEGNPLSEIKPDRVFEGPRTKAAHQMVEFFASIRNVSINIEAKL